MDARNLVQRIVTILIIVMGASFPVFASTVYTYGGNVYDRPIPANPDDTKGWMEDAIIYVPDHFTIDDLDVRINLTHTNVFDLQIFLQHLTGTAENPTETKICLNMYNFEKEFSVYPNYINTIFDDEAPVPIEQGQAPFTGQFRPIYPYELSEFDGQDAYGLWHLQIYDAFYVDTGNLDSFELIFTVPEPATAILLLLGTGLITLLNPRRT